MSVKKLMVVSCLLAVFAGTTSMFAVSELDLARDIYHEAAGYAEELRSYKRNLDTLSASSRLGRDRLLIERAVDLLERCKEKMVFRVETAAGQYEQGLEEEVFWISDARRLVQDALQSCRQLTSPLISRFEALSGILHDRVTHTEASSARNRILRSAEQKLMLLVRVIREIKEWTGHMMDELVDISRQQAVPILPSVVPARGEVTWANPSDEDPFWEPVPRSQPPEAEFLRRLYHLKPGEDELPSVSAAEQAPCVICLDPFSQDKKWHFPLSCGHDFHVGCIAEYLYKKWLDPRGIDNFTCPLCRRPVGKGVLQRLRAYLH